jgi:hypothetical protein
MGGKSTAEVILACREEKLASSNVAHFPRPSIEYSTPALEAAAEAVQVLDGKTAPQTQHSPEIIEGRKRLKLEMSGQSPQARPKVVSFEEKSYRQRYIHYLEVKERLAQGETIPPEDLKRFEIYERSDDCRAWKDLEEHNGKVIAR